MNCQEIQALVEEAVENRLSASCRRKVNLHLSRCAECRAFLAAEKSEHAALFRALNDVSDIPPPATPTAALAASLATAAIPAAKRAGSITVPLWLKRAAAIALLCGGAVLAAWVGNEWAEDSDTSVVTTARSASAPPSTGETPVVPVSDSESSTGRAACPLAAVSTARTGCAPYQSAESSTTSTSQGENQMNTNKVKSALLGIAVATSSALPLAIPAVVLAVSSARGDEMCYGQRNGSTSYSWATAGNWLNHNNTGEILNRLPTAEDDVYIWGDILRWNPLVVEAGTVALTRDFSVGHRKGENRKILFEIQDGGTMTNAGTVTLGNGKEKNVAGVATVRSGGEWTANGYVTVGYSANDNNCLTVEAGGRMTVTNGEFVVGSWSGYGGIVTNRGEMAIKDLFPGGYGTGTFVNEGTLRISNKLTIGRKDGSVGYFHQKSGTFIKSTSNQPIHVGYQGEGVFVVDTPLTLPADEILILGNTGMGELIVNAGGSITGLQSLVVGAITNVAGSRGTITLAGGEITLLAKTGDYWPLLIGGLDADGGQLTFGTIRGYGKIGRTHVTDTSSNVRMRLSGQVIADGGDLDMGLFRTVGGSDDNNKCGTNGWYAINGGRLILPRRQELNSVDVVGIGDYLYKGTRAGYAPDISLVNSLQLRLYKNGAQLTDGKYNFSMLYAADRNDIPGAIPCAAAKGDKILAVWRLGHFNEIGDVGANPQNPVAFDEASLRFRFDNTDVDLERHKVLLFRYNGSAWERVGMVSPSDPTHIATESNQPAYDGTPVGDNWNIGWYAIVRKRIGGITIIFR